MAVAALDANERLLPAELEAADRILVQQVFKPLGNEYRISVPGTGSAEEGEPLLYVTLHSPLPWTRSRTASWGLRRLRLRSHGRGRPGGRRPSRRA